MSIRKDVTVKITNNNATLDMPLQIYELDHGIELRFKLMDYKYKYTKDPQNILNSSDEDILEAYTTIINPRGYELQQINGEVKDDIVIFMIDSSYTDEIDEIGMYSLQIHIKCACSEFSIPPIQFEVLQRLKGIKVVTDGEDSIDDSALIDSYSNFISDETGKLLIEWKKGDIISSVKLNAMVEVINNAVDEEVQRQANEVKREQQELERQNKVREALNSVDARVDEAMNEYETRFNALTASQQQDAEVIDARDGETSLKARLDRDIEKAKEIYVPVEGTYVSTDSSSGYAKDIEMLGNTIQDASNLADIRSVGDKVEGQELYEIYVVSCGKNLFNKVFKDTLNNINGVTVNDSGVVTLNGTLSNHYMFNVVIPEGEYRATTFSDSIMALHVFWDGGDSSFQCDRTLSFTEDTTLQCYIAGGTYDNYICKFQLEYGTQATPYEPYQGDKLTILSPVQLEKVGNVADRIICKDGVCGVEKNVVTHHLKDYAHSDYHGFSCRTILPKSSIAKDIYTTIPFYTNLDYLHTNINFQWSNRNINSIAIEPGYCHITSENYVYQDIIKMIEENDIWVKYALLEPQFIPLPHDQQVKLRTFAGQTNIHFETEIEPTIKAQVPKSIGATVNTHTEQIGNLSKELDRVKKLEESTVSTVETESDFTTVEATSGGYFEDVKLEGKTLVNVLRLDGDWFNQETTLKTDSTINVGLSSYPNTRDISLIKPNTVYTVVSFVDYTVVTKGTLYVQLNINNYAIFKIDEYMFNKPTLIKTTEFTNITNHDIFIGGANCEYKFKNVKILMLEGDHTQNPPSFFEGLKSVGEDIDEIVVLSSGGKNLFNVDRLVKVGSNKFAFPISYLIEGKTYTISSKKNIWIKIAQKQDAASYIFQNANTTNHTFTVDNKYKGNYIFIMPQINTTNVIDEHFLRENIQLEENDVQTEFEPCIPNKKQLLYYNNETQTWEKPILRQWDSIEKHSDGKYYYHKRSGEVVLNGSEDGIVLLGDNTNSTLGFGINKSNFPNIKKISVYPNENKVFNDRFNYLGGTLWDIDSVGMALNAEDDTKMFQIKLLKTSLPTQDVQGFKQWLQANNVTVVYQLAQEKVYECTNIDLITYANETNYVVESGAIVPKSTLKVMSNISNTVRELQRKVSTLESYIQHVMTDALNNALNE